MAGYEYWELAAIAFVFLAGGVVKGGIGLGLPTVSVGLMATWMPVEQAAGILILPVILTNIWQSFFGTALKLIFHRLWTLLIALVVGSTAAAILIAEADTALAAGLLGTMLIIYAALGLTGARFSVPVRAEPALSPVMGLATGLISGATAIFVIPVVPYLQSLNFAKGRRGQGAEPNDPTRATDETMIKDALIQSLGITVLVSSAGLAIGLGARGELPVSVVIPGTIGTAMAILGMVAGRRIRNRLSLEVFRRWVLSALVVLGAVMVVRAVT
tara:strand:+ start:2126 stop:2941 length:816 start_codon:yes stop_codon:yes gene_type:complete